MIRSSLKNSGHVINSISDPSIQSLLTLSISSLWYYSPALVTNSVKVEPCACDLNTDIVEGGTNGSVVDLPGVHGHDALVGSPLHLANGVALSEDHLTGAVVRVVLWVVLVLGSNTIVVPVRGAGWVKTRSHNVLNKVVLGYGNNGQK